MTVKTTVEKKADEQQQALLRVALRAAIAQASDKQLEESRPRLLAERLARTRLDNSQVRNLENLAYTTDKVSDITDLLKKQIGRDGKAQRWASDDVGQEVIAALDGLRAEADQIVKDLSERFRDVMDADLSRRVHLELCREFVKHLAAEFMYRKRGA